LAKRKKKVGRPSSRSIPSQSAVKFCSLCDEVQKMKKSLFATICAALVAILPATRKSIRDGRFTILIGQRRR